MRTSPKTLVFYVTLLVAAISFTLVSECNAQRNFGRLPFRQQKIENRVRQISPGESADQEPAPAAEKKGEETPAPDVNEKAEKTPAPDVNEKAEKAPAPDANEKAEKAPAPEAKKQTKESPAPKKKAKEAPAVKEKAKETPAPDAKEKADEKPEASILEEGTIFPPVSEKETPDAEKAAPESPSDPLHEEAVEKVLANPDVPEEAKAALKQATKEDIQKSVEEATSEVEADNRNEHIDGVVENSRKEVDEDSIETAVNEVLDSSEETVKEEMKRSESANLEEEVDDSVPDSVNQVIQNIEAKSEEKSEADAETEDDAMEADLETEDDAMETDAEAEDDAMETDLETEDDAEETDAETEDDAKEAEAKAPSNARAVKLEDLDQELKIPENATFEELHAFLTGLDSISPADLDQTNQEVLMNQAKTFIEKIFHAKLAASDQMLALENLTDEQWKEAVSWKVQSLASLFQLDGTKIDEMREFVKEIRPKAPKDVLWMVESILIQMELAQITEKPTPDDLKKYVNRMLEHTQKGIDDDCVSLDFVLATVQMVALTEDSLPQEESREIFESAIKTLNSSETPKLKEMAKFLQKILDQREIVGKTPDLTLETYDGKTVKTADFVGKTLLIYCFQMSSTDQLQDLGLVYQIYKVFNSRGLEVIGIVPEEKNDAMDELLKQIPWPMVFEGKDAENSAADKLCVPTFPTKVLVNAEGKIENANIQPMELLKYLEAAYGPVSKPSDDDENADEAEDSEEDADEDADEDSGTKDETELADPLADETGEADEAEEAEEAEEETGEEDSAGEAKKAPAEKIKEKAAEKIDGLDLDLDL